MKKAPLAEGMMPAQEVKGDTDSEERLQDGRFKWNEGYARSPGVTGLHPNTAIGLTKHRVKLN